MMYVDFSVLDTVSKEEYLKTLRDLLTECQKAAEKRLYEHLRDEGITTQRAILLFDLEKTYASKIINKKSRFPLFCIDRYCTDVERVSCHEAFFGESRPVVIPSQTVNTMLAMVSELGKSDRADFSQYLTARYGNEVIANQKDERQLLRDRLTEYAHANVMTMLNLFSPLQIRSESDPFTTHREHIDAKSAASFNAQYVRAMKRSNVSLGHLVMMISYILGISMDYLAVRDYTATAESIYYKRYNPAKGEYTTTKITDTFVLKFLSIYLRLPETMKPEFEADTLFSLMSKGIMPQGPEV